MTSLPVLSDPDRPTPVWRDPPLWLRWVVTVLAFAGAIAGVLILVHALNKVDPGSGAGASDPSELRQANRETQIVVSADQAPHTVVLPAGTAPQTALVRAVAADMRAHVADRRLPGPLSRVRCTRTGARATTLAFRCTAVAADVNYPFVGVVDQAAKRTTYCKQDPAPTAAGSVPLSRRCRL